MQAPAHTHRDAPSAAVCMSAAVALHLCAVGIIAVAPGFERAVAPSQVSLVELVSLPETETPAATAPSVQQQRRQKMRPLLPAPQETAQPAAPYPLPADDHPAPPAFPAEQPVFSPQPAPSPPSPVEEPAQPPVSPSGTGTPPQGISVVLNTKAPASPAPASSPPQAAAADPPTVSAQDRQSYLALVRAIIERHRVYPEAARRRGQTGSATLLFTISPSGAIRSVAVERSSGYRTLDDAAVLTVRRAEPLPKPPARDGKDIAVRLTISFQLTG